MLDQVYWDREVEVRIFVGIPARMGSSRFPGKPLVRILDITMIEHVYSRSSMARNVDGIFVATCDAEIFDEVTAFGGKALMTSKEIARAGLRVAEACKQLSLDDEDIIVVVQGDEPFVHPGMIDDAVSSLVNDADVPMGSLVADATDDEWMDVNEVKVVTDLSQNILYMSRAPIPSNVRRRDAPRLKQLGIMPYRAEMLFRFQGLAPTPLEVAESVELLRAVEHGIPVRAIKTMFPSMSVDTEEDRLRAEEAMKTDALYPMYSGTQIGE